jgi:glycosyltransferase involved in cell wall biosynthesis
MTARIKILHIISNLMSGGAETMLSKVARKSGPLGVDHVVISMIAGGSVAEVLKSAGIPVHFLSAQRNFGAMTHLATVRRMVRALEPNLIQGWMYHGNIAATAAEKFNGNRRIPVIWNIRQSVQSLRKETLLTGLAILAGAPLSGTPRAIIYNSLRAAQDHERLFYARRRRVIIPNGFDTDVFRPNSDCRDRLCKQLALPNDAAIVGRVANFHSHKDFPTLIAAFAAISQGNPRAHLVLVGRGLDSTNEGLTKSIASLPCVDKVHIMGERSDVANIMPGFDVLLSSSSAEAFPNVIGEAMACGVPTVTTDVGDCAVIIGDQNRVVPPSNPRILAEKALQVLALDPAERANMGRLDRARVIALYSIDAVASTYVTLWRQIAGMP